METNELPVISAEAPDAIIETPPPVPAAAIPLDMFYKLDARNLSWREYWWGTRSPAVVIGWLLKLLRVRLPMCTDDPNVQTLAPFEVAEDALPPDIRSQFTPLVQQLGQLGFCKPVFHAIEDRCNFTRIYLATLPHSSGQALARIHHRTWTGTHPAKTNFFTMFLSACDDGTFLITSGSRPDSASPPNVRVIRKTGLPPAELWPLHQRALADGARNPVIAATREQTLCLIDQYHAATRDYHIQRGIFAPMSPTDIAQAQGVQELVRAAESGAIAHPEVMAALTELQTRKAGWTGAIAMLVISLFLFIAASRGEGSGWSPDDLWMLIPILFIHEMGHYLAMRLFHYRNLRMFFIPFLGAAVTGRNYNVAGWKKAMVSLAGPLPGIFLGGAIAFAGLRFHHPAAVRFAFMMLIINGINLLPVLPLDGGWIMNIVLFSRHHLAEMAFRILAVAALFAASWRLDDKMLLFIGIAMTLSLPVSYCLARIVSDLRRSGFAPYSADDQTIPPAAAQVIVSKLKSIFTRGQNSKTLAQHTLHIFENLNARPPGLGGSLGILALHGIGFLAAAIFPIIIVAAERGLWRNRLDPDDLQSPPRYCLSPQTIITWKGPAARTDIADRRQLIVATYPSEQAAETAFAQLPSRLPATAAASLFGQSVLLSLNTGDASASRQWLAELRQTSNNVLEIANQSAYCRISCAAPDEKLAAAIEAELAEYSGIEHLHTAPPWNPADAGGPPTPPQRFARQTYRLIETAQADIYKNPEVRQINARLFSAYKNKRKSEIEQLGKQQGQLISALRTRAVADLRKRGDREVDVQLIDDYSALLSNAPREPREYLLAMTRTLGPRFGQVPLAADGRPQPGADRCCATVWVRRQGTSLSLSVGSFANAFEGAPAIVAWLSSRDCRDFQYDLRAVDPDLLDEP